ncbi:hypothetical protein [Tahibacter amnicola]|uniref:Uncharacterized protein n=1 Tax=Tahibacter amnicola TaxID=2976241 RepID=A0ABY6B8U7_9GAMM|nr:hypothetical protein [Tahibacter amnicola]UXI66501.1 hypothetical protein N4264_17325 [Tahibacter amnicola]
MTSGYFARPGRLARLAAETGCPDVIGVGWLHPGWTDGRATHPGGQRMLLYGLGIAALLFVSAVVLGALHLRESRRRALAAIAMITLPQIESLRRECETVFRDRFGKTLSLGDFESSALLLSEYLDNSQLLKSAFARPDFYWYFILPVGAYIGELVRTHGKGTWRTSRGGGVEMSIDLDDGHATMYPFEKILKHLLMGSAGDIYAYLKSAATMEQVVSRIAPLHDPAGSP